MPEPSEIAIRTTASAAEGSPWERYWNGVLERIHCGAVFASGRFTWLKQMGRLVCPTLTKSGHTV